MEGIHKPYLYKAKAYRRNDSSTVVTDRLELYNDTNGYNIAGELLSDRNKYYGIDIVRFGESISIILDRETLDCRSLFPDKIEITSPGGLPQGVTKDDFLKGGISILRNRIIASVFFRLHLIERFGTGIRRINESEPVCRRR